MFIHMIDCTSVRSRIKLSFCPAYTRGFRFSRKWEGAGGGGGDWALIQTLRKEGDPAKKREDLRAPLDPLMAK